MSEATIEIKFPRDVYLTLSSIGMTKQVITKKLKEDVSMDLFKKRLLSFGKAAQLAGLSKWEFIDLLGRNEIPVVNYTEEEFREEMQNVRRLSKEIRK